MSKSAASREFRQKLHSCLQECPLILQVFSPPPPPGESPEKEAASPLPGDRYHRILPQVSTMAHHYEIFPVLEVSNGISPVCAARPSNGQQQLGVGSFQISPKNPLTAFGQIQYGQSCSSARSPTAPFPSLCPAAAERQTLCQGFIWGIITDDNLL